MDIDPDLLKQLYETFSVELEELSQSIVDSLLKIEGKDQSSQEVKSAIDTIFRAAHTIKGAANSLNFTEVVKVAHSLESLFSNVKSNGLNVTRELIDVSLQAVDAMKVLAGDHLNGTKSGFDSSSIISFLENFDNKEQIIVNDKSDLVTPQAQASEDSLRIDVKQLDKLSSIMDELNIGQVAIMEQSKRFNGVVSLNQQLSHHIKEFLREVNAALGGEMTELLDQMSRSVQDAIANQSVAIHAHAKDLGQRVYQLSLQNHILQDEFRMLRLVPASTLFCTMPRLVRDISRQLNKSVELVIRGDDVKVDRMVLQAIKDPIIHILRNAIDHGIEAAETRKRLGKNPTGRIVITISDQSGKIIISITDDGAGIDPALIKQAAIAKELMSAEAMESLSSQQVIDLLFMPGFSTKKEVTQISGRGVGLDVVKSNLDKIKGSVSIKSTVGQGSVFSLQLPLTLSSERGLLVKCADQVFALPTVSVDRILRISKQDLLDVAGKQVVIVDGHSYAVHLLAMLLELPVTNLSKDDLFSAVIVKNNQAGVLLLVDDIVGEQEIVIKTIHPPLSHIPCVSGGTLAGGDEVVIVLNPRDIISKATHDSSKNILFSETRDVINEKPAILVVDDSITTRTLEKNILQSRNYNVSVAVNGKEAWDYIQKRDFSLVITDVNMPIMDGFQLTEKIKQNEKYKHIPVIIVTSLDSDDEKRRGLEAGANAYIVKSEFESGVLLDIVSQLV